MKQLINEPTRYAESGNVANLRDLLAVSNESMISDSGVLSSFCNIDHLPIFATLAIDTPSISRSTTKLWDYRRTDTEKHVKLFTDIDWDGCWIVTWTTQLTI